MGKEEKRAYYWPLRNWRDRTALLALARMAPTDPNHPSYATLVQIEQWAKGFKGSVGLVWGTKGTATSHVFHQLILALGPSSNSISFSNQKKWKLNTLWILLHYF
jgi:hypothetical protein